MRPAANEKRMSADPAVADYQRHARVVTEHLVRPQSAAAAKGGWMRKLGRGISEPGDGEARLAAEADAKEVLDSFESCLEALSEGLHRLSALKRPRLLGKVEEDQKRTHKASLRLAEAREALTSGDFGTCGKIVQECDRELASMGGPLTVALNAELGQVAMSRQAAAALMSNLEQRREAQRAAEDARLASPRAAMLAATRLQQLAGQGFALAADILGQQNPVGPARVPAPQDDEIRIIPPHELETFADVGGLEPVKEQLRRTVGLMVERAGDAARMGVAHNGVLLHGPPGTGKTLLARAVAGEYGLRFIRFSPSLIGSAFQHEPAKKLRQVFAEAARAAPCLLFLDEVDAIAGRRDANPSPDQRELVTQLLQSLEDYRTTPGLVILAATNALDHLDPALREGRFDSRIGVPLPDQQAREHVLEVHLEHLGDQVEWDGIDVVELGQRTAGRSGAALASLVTGAAERALAHGGLVSQDDLLAEIDGRWGKDRPQTLEEPVYWDDVVLPEATKQRLGEILLVFQRPELGRQLGVRPPAGILLYGPPGTGKTTIARALATEVKASFYEQSAADLLSKWVGESEQKVAQLFRRARDNRPSIIFCDEIDALLKRRSADSAAPWEERVVSQFLQEIDGLGSGEGVLLVGATNRPDIIDPAVRDRRLVSIEVPLPDAAGREKLLEVLWRDVRLAADLDLHEVAQVTQGMSGADLKAIRDGAGLKALARAARDTAMAEVAVTRADVMAVLKDRGGTAPPPSERPPRARTAGQPRPRRSTPDAKLT